MTQTSGLSAIYEAMNRPADPQALHHRRVVGRIEADTQRFIAEHRDQMREALGQLEEIADRHGEMFMMMAARLFLEIHKYHLRREKFVAEFDEAFTEVARDLAQSFVLADG